MAPGMPGLWYDGWGIEIKPAVCFRRTGAEPLAGDPRRLVVKDQAKVVPCQR